MLTVIEEKMKCPVIDRSEGRQKKGVEYP